MLFGELVISLGGLGATVPRVASRTTVRIPELFPNGSFFSSFCRMGGKHSSARGMVHELGDVPEPFMTS